MKISAQTREVKMKFTPGTVFSIKRDYPPTAGCTTSEAIQHTAALSASVFSLAAHTDISAETYAHPKLLLVAGGEAESYESGGRTWVLAEGDALITPVGVPVGIRSQGGCVYIELILAKETYMNERIRAGEIVRLAELLPTQDGKIVNMDLAHNEGMKLALMSFAAGTGLDEHAAPGDALVFALEGEAIVGYEGAEHRIHAGENFKFDKGGRHYVRADQPFKMALLLVRE